MLNWFSCFYIPLKAQTKDSNPVLEGRLLGVLSIVMHKFNFTEPQCKIKVMKHRFLACKKTLTCMHRNTALRVELSNVPA